MNVLIGKLGKLDHKQNCYHDFIYIYIITSLLYKLDILLLKQKKLPVFDITGFFFRIICAQVKALMHLGLHPSTQAEKETRYMQYGKLFFFFNSSTLSYTSYRSVSINFESTKFVICSPLRRPIRYESTKSWSIEQLSCCYFFSSKLWRYFECEWWVAWHVPLPVGEWINRLSKFTKHLIRLFSYKKKTTHCLNISKTNRIKRQNR